MLSIKNNEIRDFKDELVDKNAIINKEQEIKAKMQREFD